MNKSIGSWLQFVDMVVEGKDISMNGFVNCQGVKDLSGNKLVSYEQLVILQTAMGKQIAEDYVRDIKIANLLSNVENCLTNTGDQFIVGPSGNDINLVLDSNTDSANDGQGNISRLFLTEQFSGVDEFMGALVEYDGNADIFQIGTSNLSSSVVAMSVSRGDKSVDFKGNITVADAVTADHFAIGANPLLHISIPFVPITYNTTDAINCDFFHNVTTTSNQLFAYAHPTRWFIHSVSILHDSVNGTANISLSLATNLDSRGLGTPSYISYDIVTDKTAADLCDRYVFSTPVEVPDGNAIKAMIQYSSSSANESRFVFWGFQG